MRGLRPVISAMLVAAVLFASASSAAAHPPYFFDTKPMQLPGGTSIELRVIAGDGVFVADPTRLAIFDQDDRLVGLGPRSGKVEIICRRDHCMGYDYYAAKVIEPDSTSFRIASAAIPLDAPGEVLWDIEADTASWGVHIRSATALEVAYAEMRLIWQRPDNLFYLIFGLLFGASSILLPTLEKSETRPIAFWTFWIVVATVMFGLVLVPFLMLLFVTAPPVFGLVVSTSVGFFVFRLLYQSRCLANGQHASAR